MTPKEKALELVNKYKGLVYPYLGSGMLINQENESVVLSNAKMCALIAVGEMYYMLSQHYERGNIAIDADMKFLWEVRQEIENLKNNI